MMRDWLGADAILGDIRTRADGENSVVGKADLWVAVGAASHGQGRYDVAIAAFQRALRAAPTRASLQKMLGQSFLLENRVADALDHLNRYVSMASPGKEDSIWRILEAANTANALQKATDRANEK